MPIAKESLATYENLIAEGQTKEVLKSLLSLKDQSIYKSEIISLHNLWKSVNQQQMSGAISDDDYRVALGKMNSSILLLMDYLKTEKEGDKKATISAASLGMLEAPRPSLLRTHLPWLISALVASVLVWLITSMSYQQAALAACDDGGTNINGSWYIKWRGTDNDLPPIYGKASALQDSCFRNFELSGQFDAIPNSGLPPLSFSSKVGGYSNREIYFVYENSRRERGACHGVLLSDYSNKFEVECSDLMTEGDSTNGAVGYLIFSKEPFPDSTSIISQPK